MGIGPVKRKEERMKLGNGSWAAGWSCTAVADLLWIQLNPFPAGTYARYVPSNIALRSLKGAIFM